VTTEEAVAALKALMTSEDWLDHDFETVHLDADIILLNFVPPEVSLAYQDLVDNAVWWAHA